MICLACRFKNPATVGYCQRCGAKMDFTADEIRDALVEKATDEVRRNTEFYARQALLFGAALFLVALTALVSIGTPPEDSYYIPSASGGARHLEVEFKQDVEVPKLLIPLEVRKK
jgi:hypothetical protein